MLYIKKSNFLVLNVNINHHTDTILLSMFKKSMRKSNTLAIYATTWHCQNLV